MAEIYKENPLIKILMLKGQDGKDGEDKLIDQASGSGLSFWIGTQAEYDAIPAAELIANCVYYITDNTADDLRTDINAIDIKVDNNYIGLQSQIMSTRSYLLGVMDGVVAQITELSNSFKYKAGDSGTINYTTAGYVTTANSQIIFSIPLPLYLPDTLTMSGSIRVKLRQGGSYVGGSTADSFVVFTSGSYDLSVTNEKHLRIVLNAGVDQTFVNSINNDAIGIECQFNYTVSAN